MIEFVTTYHARSSKFKVDTNYTIPLDKNRNYLRENLQGYVTLKFRPSERMMIDLVIRKY